MHKLHVFFSNENSCLSVANRKNKKKSWHPAKFKFGSALRFCKMEIKTFPTAQFSKLLYYYYKISICKSFDRWQRREIWKLECPSTHRQTSAVIIIHPHSSSFIITTIHHSHRRHPRTDNCSTVAQSSSQHFLRTLKNPPSLVLPVFLVLSAKCRRSLQSRSALCLCCSFPRLRKFPQMLVCVNVSCVSSLGE